MLGGEQLREQLNLSWSSLVYTPETTRGRPLPSATKLLPGDMLIGLTVYGLGRRHYIPMEKGYPRQGFIEQVRVGVNGCP